MNKWTLSGKSLGLGLLSVASLSACGQKPLDYSGEYEVLMGQDCTMVSELGDETFLEIAPIAEGTERGYLLRFPLGVEMGIPGFSSGAAPDENGLLTGFFIAGTDGLMGYKSETAMAMSVKPHETKPDHLWVTHWDVEEQNNLGATSQKNVLDSMIREMNVELRALQAQWPEPINLTNRTLCLGKKSRLSEADRSAVYAAAKQRQGEAEAEILATLRAMPFAEFWLLRDACTSGSIDPQCRAFSIVSQERVEAERVRELTRMKAMSNEALDEVGKTCQGTADPRCHAYHHVMDERRQDTQGKERGRFEAMDYEDFKAEEGVVCRQRWSTTCQVYKNLASPKRQAEVNRLISVHSGQALVDLEWGACNSNSPTYTRDLDLCDLTRDANSGKRIAQAVYYTDHRDELRETHNACFDEFHALRNARKAKEARAVKASFRCLTALDGARAAGVRGEFKDKM